MPEELSPLEIFMNGLGFKSGIIIGVTDEGKIQFHACGGTNVLAIIGLIEAGKALVMKDHLIHKVPTPVTPSTSSSQPVTPGSTSATPDLSPQS